MNKSILYFMAIIISAISFMAFAHYGKINVGCNINHQEGQRRFVDGKLADVVVVVCDD